MGLTIGKTTPSKIMMGETEVQRVFHGSQLVWQNKLVEGEDYDIFDWLKVTGKGCNQWQWIGNANWRIRLNKTGASSISNFISHRQVTNNSVMTISPTAEAIYFYESDTHTGKYFTLNKGTAILEYKVDDKGFYINGNLFRTSARGGMKRLDFIAATSANIINLNYIIIEGIANLAPCKLLRPCPSNLSANGKPYAEGECGMIDSITGKFFGKSNTSDIFTVYNDPVYITGCKIRIPNRYSVNPATLIVTGRVNVSKLTSTAKDYGIAKISKDYVLMGHYKIGEGVATYAVFSSTWGQGYADIKFTYDLGYAASLTINGKALTPAENPPFGQIESAMLDLTDGVLEISKVYQKVYDTAATTSEHNYTAIKKDGRFALQDDFDGQIYYQE